MLVVTEGRRSNMLVVTVGSMLLALILALHILR